MPTQVLSFASVLLRLYLKWLQRLLACFQFTYRLTQTFLPVSNQTWGHFHNLDKHFCGYLFDPCTQISNRLFVRNFVQNKGCLIDLYKQNFNCSCPFGPEGSYNEEVCIMRVILMASLLWWANSKHADELWPSALSKLF